MNDTQRQVLESAGFRIGTVQDFLGLEEWEARFIELKYRARKTAKRLREASALTQHDVARRIKSSQSRIAKIESGSEDISLDLLARYLFAVGGTFEELDDATSSGPVQPVETSSAAKVATSRKKRKELVP